MSALVYPAYSSRHLLLCLLALRGALICPTTMESTCCDSQLFSLKLLWKRATSSNSPKAGSLVLCLMNYLCPGVRQKQQSCIKKKNKKFLPPVIHAFLPPRDV